MYNFNDLVGELDDVDDNLLLLRTENPILLNQPPRMIVPLLCRYIRRQRRQRPRGKGRTTWKDNNVIKVFFDNPPLDFLARLIE